MTLTKDDDTPLERAYVREEARRRKARAALLPIRQITPVITEKQLAKLKPPFRIKRCFLTPDVSPNEIEPNVVYKDDMQIKFLLLPKVISEAAWLKAYIAATDARKSSLMTKGTRGPDAQVYGRKLTLGWLPQRPGYSKKSGYCNIRTSHTLKQPGLVAALYPLLREMDALVDMNVPDYHDYAWRYSMLARRRDVRDPATHLLVDEDNLDSIADPRGYQVVKNIDPWNMTYTIRGTTFSTVELNYNIVFKAHADGNNVRGTCVCITTLGSYAGGRLVFPKYGYSAELEPRDLLLCDNNKELHGNLGPIVGDRYSVVAFLHNSVLHRAPVAD